MVTQLLLLNQNQNKIQIKPTNPPLPTLPRHRSTFVVPTLQSDNTQLVYTSNNHKRSRDGTFQLRWNIMTMENLNMVRMQPMRCNPSVIWLKCIQAVLPRSWLAISQPNWPTYSSTDIVQVKMLSVMTHSFFTMFILCCAQSKSLYLLVDHIRPPLFSSISCFCL